MKTLVLTCAVFLMLSFTKSETNRTSQTYTFINATNLAKPGCESRCGDLIVPYPFGIGLNANCSIDPGFDIYCDTSVHPPKASVIETSYLTIKLISDSTLRTSNMVAMTCYANGTTSASYFITLNYTNMPYTVTAANKFTVIGCDDYAWLTSKTKSRNVSTGCIAFCPEPDDALVNQCSGNGCCQSSIPQDTKYFTTEIQSMADVNYSGSFNRCTYAFVGEENEFMFNGPTDLNNTYLYERVEANVPLVLEWAIGNLSCPEAQEAAGFACQSNSKCVNSTSETSGYRCICNEGYDGNPYLPPGCQDINECQDPTKFPCYGTCFNTPGNYTCKCKGRYTGDGKIRDGCRHKPFQTLLLCLGNHCLSFKA